MTSNLITDTHSIFHQITFTLLIWNTYKSFRQNFPNYWVTTQPNSLIFPTNLILEKTINPSFINHLHIRQKSRSQSRPFDFLYEHGSVVYFNIRKFPRQSVAHRLRMTSRKLRRRHHGNDRLTRGGFWWSRAQVWRCKVVELSLIFFFFLSTKRF